ncbi:MAG: hypothetical protein QXU82_00440 [Candidatus Aenigmatarchaeota archaeon]
MERPLLEAYMRKIEQAFFDEAICESDYNSLLDALNEGWLDGGKTYAEGVEARLTAAMDAVLANHLRPLEAGYEKSVSGGAGEISGEIADDLRKKLKSERWAGHKDGFS